MPTPDPDERFVIEGDPEDALRGLLGGVMGERHGRVWIAEVENGPGESCIFTAYWEADEPEEAELLGESPDFPDANKALAWGRARAEIVMIRLRDSDYYSAGDRAPAHKPDMPRWPH